MELSCLSSTTYRSLLISIHLAEHFSVIRLSIRFPGLRQSLLSSCCPLLSSTSFPLSPENHDGDNEGQIESRVQSFELCFHADFAGTPDPISLHLYSSSSSPVLSTSSIISNASSVVLYRYKPAPLLKTPPPPFYELP
ncbi:hypothetical protein CGRA01v4_15110 [Colletotrichum graminicola]|nr:hypothetical protein CGRA01v4_15110 [Colletotrichum graminicola]